MAQAIAMPRQVFYFLPILIFAVVAGYFFWGLDPARDPGMVPTVMIDKPVPDFDLPPIEGTTGPGLSADDLRNGEVTLVNFFASWCIPCRVEHGYITELAERDGERIVGINYKNKPEEALAWLAELGNPYRQIGADFDGRAGIEWGVYGLPETFIVDKTGRIRFRHVGPLDPEVIRTTIKPILKELRQ
jgi:cytochrome c biogenesis protein CcmG/thiol:disulfide interchange protein DsbE